MRRKAFNSWGGRVGSRLSVSRGRWRQQARWGAHLAADIRVRARLVGVQAVREDALVSFLGFFGGGELPACVNEAIMNSSIRNKSQIIAHSWRHMVIAARPSSLFCISNQRPAVLRSGQAGEKFIYFTWKKKSEKRRTSRSQRYKI